MVCRGVREAGRRGPSGHPDGRPACRAAGRFRRFYGLREGGTLIDIESLQRKADLDGLAIFRGHLLLPDGATSIRATATLTAAVPDPGSTTMLSNGLAVSAAG